MPSTLCISNYLRFLAAVLCMAAGSAAWAQFNIPPAKPPINVGWFPKTVSYAPDESNFIVTACRDPRFEPQKCTIMRYSFANKSWQSLTQIDNDATYDDVAYTWDGDAIFAQEYGRCESPPPGNPTLEYCARLVLLDPNGKKLRNLVREPHNTYAWPSLTRDGKRILYWGISNQLVAGLGGGAWDVKELDIATQATVQKTDYQAAFPKTTPRYMPDGKRLMLVAEEYPKRPNGQDFMKPDPVTGRLREVYYMSKFGRNMTVVVDPPRGPVLPYFPTLKKVERDGKELWEPVAEHMWLMVRDISRDQKLAVFDRQGVGMCFRFMEEPLRKEECFTTKRSFVTSASIAASNKTVAIVSGGDAPSIYWVLRIIDVATGSEETIGMRW